MRAIVISRQSAGCCPSIQRSLERSSVHWMPLGHQSGSDDMDTAGLSMGGSSTTSSSSSESSRSPMPRRPKHDMSAKPINHFRQRLYSAPLIAPPSTDVTLISSMSRSTVTCHRGGRIDRHGPACRYIPRSTVRRIISGWLAFSSAWSCVLLVLRPPTDRVFRVGPPEAADPVPRVFPECRRSKASHRTSASIGECRPKGIDGATGSSGRLRGLLPSRETTPPPLAPRNAFGARQTSPPRRKPKAHQPPRRHGARGLTSAAGARPWHSHTGNPWRGSGSNPTPLLRGASRRPSFLAPRSKAGWRNDSSSSTPRTLMPLALLGPDGSRCVWSTLKNTIPQRPSRKQPETPSPPNADHAPQDQLPPWPWLFGP